MKLNSLVLSGIISVIAVPVFADADNISGVLANEKKDEISKPCVPVLNSQSTHESSFQHNMLSSASGDSNVKGGCSFDSLKRTAKSEQGVFDQRTDLAANPAPQFSVMDDHNLANEKTRLQNNVTTPEKAEFSRFTASSVEEEKTKLQSAVTTK